MNDPSKVESILLAALEKATPEARSAYLDDVCRDNPGLREQVNRLLAAHPKAVEFLEMPAAAVEEKTAGYVPSVEKPGSILVGRYKLLEMIGEGGMGEVWVADQLEPIKRRVALKLIKPGMDSRSVLGRFEAERQALAVMDHPNIAKVLDAGSTDNGRPYFVMELVKGTPITEFCDARRLTTKERLELFVPVCQAIQHAHQKGIIHRDIKPSNVLVTLHDETPVPKVIDFGVAKAIGQQLTEKTIYTGFGNLVGTPTYMAPEQATFNQIDIDTRADIYAVGVLLYEVLAGSPPVEPERLKRAALDEVLRIVRDEEPPRPSVRLSTSEGKASIAAMRQIDPSKLSALMRGEIDWIVMKALEKDRTRRYDSATAFAKDLQRYLAGEAVQAHPPSAWYQFSKIAKKKKREAAVAVVVLMLLMLGIAGTTWQAGERRREREIRRLQADQAAISAADRAEAALEANRLFDVDTALGMIDAKQVAESPELQKRTESIRRDRRMAETLEGIFEDYWMVCQFHTTHDAEPALARYAVAFREYGVPPDESTTADRVRNSRIQAALIDGLTTWYFIDSNGKGLQQLLDRLDPDRFRSDVRAAKRIPGGDRVRELAKAPEALQQSPVFAVMHAASVGDRPSYRILESTWGRHPDSFPIALAMTFPGGEDGGPTDRLSWCRTAVALRPNNPVALVYLSLEYKDKLYTTQAEQRAGIIMARIESLRRAVNASPRFALAHAELGDALAQSRKEDEALVSLRRAIELDPKTYTAYVWMIGIHFRRQEWLEASKTYRAMRDSGSESADEIGCVNAYAMGRVSHYPESEIARGLIDLKEYHELVRLCVSSTDHEFNVQSADDPNRLQAEVERTVKRFLPAGAAVQSSFGRGIDPPSPQKRPAVRAYALDWLSADLKACETKYNADKAKLGPIVHAMMNRWLAEPMLADVRGDKIAALPRDEQPAWQVLWNKVAAIRDQTVPTPIPAKE